MKNTILEVSAKRELADKVFELEFRYDGDEIIAPGQFINIKLKELYLRRPISVCDYKKDSIKAIIKEVGIGTGFLHKSKIGDRFEALIGLGNGFSIEKQPADACIVGGGVGVPPLYGLAKKLINNGTTPKVLLGFNSRNDVFYENEFKDLGLDVEVFTVCGDYGREGLVIDGLANNCYVYACGPIPMLQALCVSEKVVGGQLSLEERMGCGFGACMGCSIKTKKGNKRVCKDGPVFNMEELLWQI